MSMATKQLLEQHFAALRKEEAEILAKTVALKAEREKWSVTASEANAKANALTDQIHAIERPEGGRSLLDVKRELSAIANSLGAMRLAERG
jgi:hypothetical protein